MGGGFGLGQVCGTLPETFAHFRPKQEAFSTLFQTRLQFSKKNTSSFYPSLIPYQTEKAIPSIFRPKEPPKNTVYTKSTKSYKENLFTPFDTSLSTFLHNLVRNDANQILRIESILICLTGIPFTCDDVVSVRHWWKSLISWTSLPSKEIMNLVVCG